LEIKIDLDKIRNDVKLFVATPMYGGQCTGLYAKSSLDLQNIFTRYNIELKFSFLFNESLIQRARNYLADEFMRSDSTHLLFIDADIHYDAKDVLALLALDVPVVAGVYPKKTLNLKALKEAVLKNPDIEVNYLEQLLGEFVFNVKKGTKQFNTTELVEVSEVGTGFLLIKREVFEKMNYVYSDYLLYIPDHANTQHFDGSRKIMEYFPVMVDRPDNILGGDSFRLLSEDYTWSKLVGKLGIPLYIAPFLRLNHVGTYEFKGNLQAIAQTIGKL
jgi:hypothetical protein